MLYLQLLLTITIGYLTSCANKLHSEYVVTLSSDQAQRPHVQRSGWAMEILNHATIQAEAKAKAGLGLRVLVWGSLRRVTAIATATAPH